MLINIRLPIPYNGNATEAGTEFNAEIRKNEENKLGTPTTRPIPTSIHLGLRLLITKGMLMTKAVEKTAKRNNGLVEIVAYF